MIKTLLTRIALGLALLAAGLSSASGQTTKTGVPDYVAAAVADPGRPADQRARDAVRKPAEVVAFAGIKPGDRVADFISASGYFTRILSRVVGPDGRVYTFTPDEELRNCSVEETAGTFALARDRAYANVVTDVAPVNDFTAPAPLDAIWTSLNYHDLHDRFLGPADVARLDRNFFHALKPGGVLLIIDHVAQAGSGLRDTETLHRIDPETIVKEVGAAGFLLEARSDILHNPADDHTQPVFAPAIRGNTDQVGLKFRKPAASDQ